MRAKKSLGQNFLMHRETAARIVHAAQVSEGTTVLEIGPGTGMLTRELLSAGHTVIAVEADGELVDVLKETFEQEIGEGKLTLVHADIRNVDIQRALQDLQNDQDARRGKPRSVDVLEATAERRGRDPQQSRLDHFGGSYAVVANIPYYITGELIRTFLTTTHKPVSMTLLVQKEVAERIARSGEGKKEKESLLSLSVKAFGTPEYCFTVPKGAFKPAPKVDSAVISIRDIRKDAFDDADDERFFFSVLRTGFAHRRKLLSGNLSDLFSQKAVLEAFLAAAIPEKARAEDLPFADWQRLIGELRARAR